MNSTMVRKYMFALFLMGMALTSVVAQNQISNNYVGSNGENGLSDYGMYTLAQNGQATMGAEGVGDTYANLNLGTTMAGVRRFWHISKRRSTSDHNLEFFYYDGNSFNNPLFTFASSGNLGINTSKPQAKLHISHEGGNGEGGLRDYAVLAEADDGQATIGAEGKGDIYANLNLGTNISGVRRFWHISKRKSTAAHNLEFFFFDGSSFNDPLFAFKANGSMGIGTTSTGTHKLAVEGSIGAREVRVEAGPWPDYVFEESYRLPSLPSIEQYIQKEKHLPEVPSAQEVGEHGVDLGEMNRLLLQKIEEMTLYLIQLDKANAQLRQEFKAYRKDTEEELEAQRGEIKRINKNQDN